MGLFWKKATGNSAVAGLAYGFVLGSIKFLIQVLEMIGVEVSPLIKSINNIQPYYYSFFILVTSLLVIYLVSSRSPAPQYDKIKNFIYDRGDLKINNTHSTTMLKVLSFIFVCCFGVIYYVFW